MTANYCPFCQSTDVHGLGTASQRLVQCLSCFAAGPPGNSDAEAIAKWNAVPRWHDEPTGPGLWVVSRNVWERTVVRVDEDLLSKGHKFGRCFGPLPNSRTG